MMFPNVDTTIKMAYSLDGISYSPFVAGASQFIPQMRYLKLRLEFLGSSDVALMELYNLTINLSVKRENDGGEVYADYVLPSDPGTEVLFNKAFKDIESITCTTKSITEPFYVIFDFTEHSKPNTLLCLCL